MGLKTTNYEVKALGQTLPTAYALLDSISQQKNSVLATFGIYTNRENASKYKPIEMKKIHFTWDRKSNIAEQAYLLAKSKDGVLHGWDDDIVEGE